MDRSETLRWRRAQAVFATALDADPHQPERILDMLPPGETVLRADVRALIAAHRSRGFVDELAERLAGPLASTPAPPVPSRIGRYEVLEPIGQGGMGVVYKARDPQLGRFVAVKRLLPGPHDEARRRLLAEARAAAAFDHPAIATVYEVGEIDDGHLFLAMAFYEGETLAARLARGPLPMPDAMRLAREIAGGLAAAHARGIAHRDLKPGNVLLTSAGAVKLLDFGLAGVEEAREAGLLAMAGTLPYMAPERVRGEVGGPRADVWAFGVVLHEMLTGERPPGDVQAGGRWSPPAKQAAWPPALAVVLARALSAAPADRYRDARELLAALEVIDDVRSPAPRPSDRIVRLPSPLTTFFGREREIADIAERIDEVRLLTLTGPGGSGKTRLAQQVAAIVRDRFEHGVVFVSLAPLSDPALVPSEIAQAIGLPERATDAPLDALAAALTGRRVLLVLDNVEHVVLAAPALSRLLGECPALRVLATSRVPLKLAGEHEYPVPPLPLPPPGAGRDDLRAHPAAALFLDRLRAVRPDFTPAEDDRAAILELCCRLDGLPLAIELAAARGKLLSPRALVARLDQRLDLLRTAGADRPARHHSLRAAIAWSYDLLQPDEQALFRALSVFAGGGRLEDVGAVGEAIRPAAADLVDASQSLVDHSLVRREDDPDGTPRLRPLETIREFAFERLQAEGETREARDAHAARFLALAEEAERHLTGPDQAAWFTRLEHEHANLRAAQSWVHTTGRAETAMRFGAALWRFWLARGHLREGRERLEQLLAADEAAVPPLLRGRVLHAAATLIHEISEFGSARPLAEDSVALARAHGDRPLLALALNNLGWLLARMGDAAEAARVCGEALALNRDLGDQRGIAVALHNLGWLAAHRGDLAEAVALNEESVAWRRAHGDPRGVAYALTDLAWTEIQRGNLVRAAALLAEARGILDQVGDRQLLAWALVMEGLLARAERRIDDAGSTFDRSIAIWRDVGNIFGLGFTLVSDAEAALDTGRRDRARRDLDEALPLLRRTGGCWGLVDGVRARARLALAEGDPAAARGAWEEALALAAKMGDAHTIAALRRQLASI